MKKKNKEKFKMFIILYACIFPIIVKELGLKPIEIILCITLYKFIEYICQNFKIGNGPSSEVEYYRLINC